jgi:hypothetical protein
MLRRWYQGVFVFLAIVAAICAPFFLPAIGFMPAMYTVHDDTLVMTSHLHHFPPVATQVALIMGTVGAAAGAVVFGRLYANEIRRAEERLTFQAWQLQQLTAAD